MEHRKECKGCGGSSLRSFLDLGEMPLANGFLAPEQLEKVEPRFRLEVLYCPDCHLVQLSDTVLPKDLFSNYLYFSSFSESFLIHAREMAEALTQRFVLGKKSFVLEIASNDGYLLKNFLTAGIPVLGVEPAENIADVAEKNGVPTLRAFFDEKTAGFVVNKYGPADIVIGNNVLAHVPDVKGFLKGVNICLCKGGTAVFEVPWLNQLIAKSEFDTIYHEHVFYYSLTALVALFERAGLCIFDAEVQPVHGGSLRIFAQHECFMPFASSVEAILKAEKDAGLTVMATYQSFSNKVKGIRDELLRVLTGLKSEGKRISAYGAAAKGSVMLNYCGIGTDIVDAVFDLNTYKQGLYTPGGHIPICPPERAVETKPDYLLILPWNLKDEIMRQMDYIRQWGGRFIVAVPEVKIF